MRAPVQTATDMTSLDQDLADVGQTIAETEQGICQLERQVDAAQAAALPSHDFEATLRAAHTLLGALFAKRESLLARRDREESRHDPP